MCDLEAVSVCVYIVCFFFLLHSAYRHGQQVTLCTLFRTLVIFTVMLVIVGLHITSECPMGYVKFGAGLLACMFILLCLDGAYLKS